MTGLSYEEIDNYIAVVFKKIKIFQRTLLFFVMNE